jgi:hypothetical protein
MAFSLSTIPTFFAGATLMATALTARTAHAAERQCATLTYAAIEGCPTEAAFRRQVAMRLGYDPFVAGAQRKIDVAFAGSGRRLNGRILIKAAGTADAVRALDDASVLSQMFC